MTAQAIVGLVVSAVGIVVVLLLVSAVRVVKQYERGVHFRLGRGVEVTLVELKDIQLPDSMKRAIAREAEAEREKRAKIIAAEGEARAAAALGDASDTMMRHPLALQLRNLQMLAELGVEKNTTAVFPAPLMSAIGELGAFLARESAAATAESAGNGHAISAGTAMTTRIGASRETRVAD